MRFLKYSLIIGVTKTTRAYGIAVRHYNLPTMIYKDVFSNLKLKAEVFLTLSHAHDLPLTEFQFLRIIICLSIDLRAYSKEGEVLCLMQAMLNSYLIDINNYCSTPGIM